MSTPVPPFPTRPAEVPHGVGLAQLVEAYNGHQWEVLVGSRTRPADVDAVFAHALAALALLHALVDRLQAARWSTIRTALAADAGRGPEVAAACGLDGSEVAAGLRSWADGQVAAGLMARPEWGTVELLARSVGGER
jgi:hypothetical protein